MLYINSLDSREVLSSYNFARKSDFVFSEIISRKQFEELDKSNLKIIYADQNKIFYKATKFEIQNNQIVFCNTYFVKNFFKLINQIPNLKNIQLITHQTDLPINKKLFNLKPEAVSKWYSINVDYHHPDLIPIPIGLSNEYSPKNVFKKDYESLNFINLDEKEDKIYVNFQKNTRFISRSILEKNIKNLDLVKFDKPDLTINQYLNKINSYRYVLCPRGNGIDTHRIWETLYAGSIPILEEEMTYQTCDGLPVIFVKNFNELNDTFLNLIDLNLNLLNFSNEKLTVSYWLNQINLNVNKNKAKNSKKNLVIEDEIDFIKSINQYKRRIAAEGKIKKITTLNRRIFQKFLDLYFGKIQ